MANASPKNNPWGFKDKRQGRSSDTTQLSPTTVANLKDTASRRARLAAISSTTYTPAVLDAMTDNDMLYAIRLNDEAGSI